MRRWAIHSFDKLFSSCREEESYQKEGTHFTVCQGSMAFLEPPAFEKPKKFGSIYLLPLLPMDVCQLQIISNGKSSGCQVLPIHSTKHKHGPQQQLHCQDEFLHVIHQNSTVYEDSSSLFTQTMLQGNSLLKLKKKSKLYKVIGKKWGHQDTAKQSVP